MKRIEMIEPGKATTKGGMMDLEKTFIINEKGEVVRIEDKSVIARLDIYANKLYETLKTAEIGRLYLWDELKEVAGIDVRAGQGKGYQSLKKARDLLKVTHGYFFDSVVGEGIQRISEQALADSSGRFVNQINKRSRTAIRTLTNCIKSYDALPQESRVSLNLSRSFLQAVKLFTSKKAIKKLAESEIIKTAVLPPQTLLNQFKAQNDPA